MLPSMLLHICTKSGRENTFLPIVFPNNVHIKMRSLVIIPLTVNFSKCDYLICPCQVFVGKNFLNANSELMVKFENFL